VRLSSICVSALGAVFVVGLLPGLYGQAEIAEPGLQVVGKEQDYNLAISIHIVVFAGMLPLIGIALALAVIAEARESRRARIAAIVALGAAALRAVVLGEWVLHPPSLSETVMRSTKAPDLFMLPLAAAGLAALVLVAVVARHRRAAAVVFAILSGIVLLLSAMFYLVLVNSGIDHALHGTYYVLGGEHLAGVSIALSILGGLTVWSMRWEGVKRTVFSLVAGMAVLLTGGLYGMAASALGFFGMPLGYVDYTPAFGPPQAAHALYAAGFAAVLVASLIWLAILAWRQKKPPGVETTFE
jgi:heme/copper-type cytochrome/quinol oxidase subunit 1